MNRVSEEKELYVGVDVHEKESQLAILEPRGSLVEERRVQTDDLSRFIGALPGRKHIAVESIGFIYPVYDKLSKLPQCDVAVANPGRVLLIARSRTKNDKIDARVLGELLRTDFLPRSHMPDPETREKRLLINDRVRYGLRRGELQTSIRWLLKRRGISIKRVFVAKGRKELRALNLREIDFRLDELELVDSIVKRLDKQISEIVANDPNAKLLDTLPGVAPYTALFLSSTLDDVDRFVDSKHACAYLGLVPSLHQSGQVSYSGHITKTGNKWLRRNLIECARVAIRTDPHLRESYNKLRHRIGGKKSLIAVARRLVAYAFWMLKRNLTYEELAPWNGS